MPSVKRGAIVYGVGARSSAGFARAVDSGEASEGAVEAPSDGAAWASTS